MKLLKFVLFSLLPVWSLSGCSITQTVNPVTPLDSNLICIINNDNARETFRDAYKLALEKKNYEVKLLASSAVIGDCSVSSTYTANWRWDMAMYMAYAEINVFKNGQKAGDAIYSSLSGGANMGKFIKAEPKINELVDLLFPGNYNGPAASENPQNKGQQKAAASAVDLKYKKLKELKRMQAEGLITKDEYDTQKTKLLNN